MSRLAVFFAFLAFALAAQAQVFSHGAPASVVSPEADGRQHGIPASVVSPEPDGRQHGIPASAISPTPLPFGVNPPPPPFILAPHHPPRRFGTGGRGHHRNNNLLFVPVPLFYPIYPDAAYPVADPSVQAPVDAAEQAPATTTDDPAPAANGSTMSAEDALRAAYLQGARDALIQQQQGDARYGGHYLDSREQSSGASPEGKARRKQAQESDAAAPTPSTESDWPATVFIFKDGHKIETRNFAIVGQILYDFSSQVLKKIELADLDKEATIKANDDRGIQVKLP